MPEQFYGKKVEVIVVELNNFVEEEQPTLPPGRKISVDELFESFGAAADFPPIDEIRTKAWPSK